MAKHKDYDYFQYFVSVTEDACRAADYLCETLEHYDADKIALHMSEMHTIENDADLKKHLMMEKLSHEFLPPIEREDIVALSHELDNIVDFIDDVMRHLYMFNITEIRADAKEFAASIAKCCRSTKIVAQEFAAFKKSKVIHEAIVEVNTMESDGDTMHASCMRELFCADTDVQTRLVWLPMYDCLENCLDACENAVNIIETVIMKNT